MKQHAPAAERNKDAILAVLQDVLPAGGLVLEVASGSGQHAVHFVGALNNHWQPTDLDDTQLASIRAWCEEHPHERLLAPRLLDVSTPDWHLAYIDDPNRPQAIVSVNMVHIAHWQVAEGLFAGAGRLLPVGGVLYLYGPFKRAGRHTAASNEEFDRWLKQRDTHWGVRNLEDIEGLGGENGLTLAQVIEMPANNLSLVFTRSE